MLIDQLAWGSLWRDKSVGKKILIALIMILLAFIIKNIYLYLVLFLMQNIILFFALKITGKNIFKLWRFPFIFILMGVIPLFVEGSSKDTLFSFQITLINVPVIKNIIGRAICAYGGIMFLAITTPFSDLLDQFAKWKFPKLLLSLIAIIYNQIFIVLTSFAKIISSSDLRLGYSSIAKTIKTLGMVMGSVLSCSMKKAQIMSQSLECRFYDSDKNNTWPLEKINLKEWTEKESI